MVLTILWLVLFASLVLWLAYQRASLAKATIALGVLPLALEVAGEPLVTLSMPSSSLVSSATHV